MKRSKNIFDKIGSLIPGYRGYAERDSRRNCDKLMRNNIADEITKCESFINDRIKTEVKNNKLDSLQDLEECRQKLNTLSEKIKYAPYGESSFFGDSQIKEDELQNIYDSQLRNELYHQEVKIKADNKIELISEEEIKQLSRFELRRLHLDIEKDFRQLLEAEMKEKFKLEINDHQMENALQIALRKKKLQNMEMVSK